MTALSTASRSEGTSARVAVVAAANIRVISVAALSFWGFAGTTSVVSAAPARHDEIAYVSFQTGNGEAVRAQAVTEDAAPAIKVRQLHARSGLSWEQVSRLFGVSRRAVHLWSAGGRMTEYHARLLERHAAVVAQHDCGDPEETKRHLLAAGAEARSPYELMVNYQLRLREKPLRAELPAATLLEATEPTPQPSSEVVRSGRRLGGAVTRSVDERRGSA